MAGTTTPTGASMPQTGGLLTGCLPADFTVRPGTFSTSTGVTAFPYSFSGTRRGNRQSRSFEGGEPTRQLFARTGR